MKESEIRPQDIFDQYLKLSVEDARAMQARPGDFVDVCCPACGSKYKSELFVKNGFHIQSCRDCESIFCSPRPSVKQLEHLYAQSVSARFWATDFFPKVAEARREKLFRPKARQIFDRLQACGMVPARICDVGAGGGLLLEELHALWPASVLYAVEPGKDSARICRQKGFQVLEKLVEDSQEWAEVADLVTCFEVIEHVYDPKALVKALYELVRPSGYCLVTGLCGDGFDIQALGAQSKSIFPPHHLNFMSVRGLDLLFRSAGFKDIQITTPGKLDVDIVRNALKDASTEVHPFFRKLLDRGEQSAVDLQEFLAEYQLSSHVWVLAHRD